MEFAYESRVENYSKHNNYSITFCDFGMSEKARTFCKKHGTLLQTSSKAMAFPKNPYENTLWIDINYEIKQTPCPLFEMTSVEDGFAIFLIQKNKDHNVGYYRI